MVRIVRCACGQEMRVPPQTLHRYGKCVACGTRLKITEFNSRLDSPGEEAGQGTVAPGPAEDTCAACGRPFQADWDRNTTDAGVCCNRCSRQISSLPTASESRLTTGPDHGPVEPIRSVSFSTIEKPRKPKKPPTKKEVLFFCLASAVAFTLIMVLPVEVYLAEFFSIDPDELRNLPEIQQWVLRIAGFVFDILYYAALLFVGLTLCNQLPSEHADENFKAIGLAAVILWVVSFVPFLGYFIQIIIAVTLFGLDIFHIPAFFLAGLLLMPVKWAMQGLVYGVLAALLTRIG